VTPPSPSQPPSHALPPHLAAVVDRLVAATTHDVSLDQLGDALGTMAVTPAEIEAIVSELEARGRRVGEARAPSPTATLQRVLRAARELGDELGRRPTPAEVRERAGVSDEAMQHALALARVMQR